MQTTIGNQNKKRLEERTQEKRSSPEPKRSMLLREGERSRGGQVLVLLAVALPLEYEPSSTPQRAPKQHQPLLPTPERRVIAFELRGALLRGPPAC